MNDTNWTGVQENTFDEFNTDKIILLCIYIPVFFVALVGNILVLVMVCMNKSVRRNVANYFLVNLAVADLLVTIVCIPMTVTVMIYPVWIYGDFMCRTLDFMQGVSIEGSVITIVCMGTERYFAIRHPMKVRSICNEFNVKVAIAVTWILAIIIMCPMVMYKRLVVDQHVFIFNSTDYLFNGTQEIPSFHRETCQEDWPSTSDKIAYDIFLLFIVYIIPGFIVVALYSLIGCSLCRQNHALNRANSVISNDVKVMASRRKLARMMIIISVLFALCWLPYFIIIMGTDFYEDYRNTLAKLYPFALLLAHSHSAQNPILYCFMHRGFLEFLTKLARCQFSSITNRRQMKNSFTSSDRTQSLRISKMNDGTNDERKRLVVTLSDPGKAV
ncbi:QRFP-like peptide receptor [Mytilus edulis]